MSLRQVRRLLEPHKSLSEERDLPDESGSSQKPDGKALNRYKLLLGSDADCAPDDDDEKEDNVKASDESGDHIPTPVAGKKKRKKKKKKIRTANEDDVDEDFPDLSESPAMPSSAPVPEKRLAGQIFRIEKRCLNYENEKLALMTRNSQLANKLMHASKRRGHESRITHSHLMVSPKHWTKFSKLPMTMDLEKREGDVSFFRLVHKTEYQTMQCKLVQALESPDPNNLITLLNLYPTHAELLLQVSDLVHKDDRSMAAELIERSVSCFESVLHPRFLLSLGYSRLDYRRNENRPFFVCLFKHAHVLGQKGYHRTALEVCKLLLTLDPSGDPLGVIHVIDFHTLMSNQIDFLISLYDSWKEDRKVHMLPNFCMSVAFAYFKKANSLKQVNYDLMQTADSLLQDAILRFPALLLLLLDKCSVEPDRSVLQCGLFTVSSDKVPPALRQLLVLYSERFSTMWSSDRESIHWLERNVNTLIEESGEKIPVIETNQKLISKFYSGLTPRNVLRHVLLTDFRDSRSCLPPYGHCERMYAFDPLPPTDAIESYAVVAEKAAAGSSNSSILGLFMQSWMPDFDPEAATAESDGSRLRFSVSSLMDAMKNLLTTANERDADE